MQIVLIGLVVVFVVAAGYLFSAGSSVSGKQTQLKSTLNQDQVLYTKGLAQKTDLETTAADLAGQLAAAQASAAASAFRSFRPDYRLRHGPVLPCPRRFEHHRYHQRAACPRHGPDYRL